MGNIPVKTFCIWVSDSGDVIQRYFSIFSSGSHFVQLSGTIYAILEEGIMGTFL